MVLQDVSEELEANLRETAAILKALNLTGVIDALQGINLVDNIPLHTRKVQIQEGQVRNNAGGFVFEVSDVTRIRRFLILGTEGGTYYVQEKELTLDNVRALVKMLDEGRGGLLLREIVEISLAGRAPKQEPTLMALALLGHYRPSWLPDIEKVRKLRDPNGLDKKEYDQKMSLIGRYTELKQAAFAAVPKVCRIPTHLFKFVKFSKMISQEFNKSDGWGRAMRDAIAEWYKSKGAKELAMHITRYPKSDGYSHRDLLRLSHPRAAPARLKRRWDDRCPPQTLVYDQLFHYACTGRLNAEKRQLPVDQDEPARKRERCDYEITPEMVQEENASQAIRLINAVAEAKTFKPNDHGSWADAEERCAELIHQHGLVREHVPTKLLKSTVVWAALLEKMPITPLIRNLSKLSALGMISEDAKESSYVDSVVAKLTDEAAIQKARIHPVSVLLAAATYKKGRKSLEWTMNDPIEAALNETFLKTFKNVEPTGKHYCLAIDVSGSMSSPVEGGSGIISCREASIAMCKVFLETEPLVECMAFQEEFVPLPFKNGGKLTDMVQHAEKLPSGSMDCVRPMLWALEERKKFDVFIVFTANGTSVGEVHPLKALQDYRRKMGVPDAKLVVMGMTSTDFTIADPTDPGMLDVCGFDAAIPELVRSFVLGQL